MLLTPLLLDFSQNIFPVPEVIPPPPSEASLSTKRLPLLSPVNYYIKLFYPVNFNQFNIVNQGFLQFNIPLDPAINNQVRIALPPSVGLGKESCYRVEYWKWQKPIALDSIYKATKTKVFEEYWKIPTSDRLYINSYWEWRRYQSRDNFLNSISLTRGATDIDSLLNNLDVISVQSIMFNATTYINYEIVDDSLFWQPPYILNPIVGITDPVQPATSTIGIKWLTGSQPTVGASYQVNYILPMKIEDVIYIDYQGNTVLDTYNTTYTLSPNTPLFNNYFPY